MAYRWLPIRGDERFFWEKNNLVSGQESRCFCNVCLWDGRTERFLGAGFTTFVCHYITMGSALGFAMEG